MGFFRNQQINAAMRYLQWQYEKKGQPVPVYDQLRQQAIAVVDDAHRIAQRTGKNVLTILADMIRDIKRR